jgi:hypothetical protein
MPAPLGEGLVQTSLSRATAPRGPINSIPENLWLAQPHIRLQFRAPLCCMDLVHSHSYTFSHLRVGPATHRPISQLPRVQCTWTPSLPPKSQPPVSSPPVIIGISPLPACPRPRATACPVAVDRPSRRSPTPRAPAQVHVHLPTRTHRRIPLPAPT